MFGKKMIPDAVKRAFMPARTNPSGPGQSVQPVGTPPPTPFFLAPARPSMPNFVEQQKTGENFKFIAPLAMFNDALQWVQTVHFPKPMSSNGAASSWPSAPMPTMICAPLAAVGVAAGNLNLQETLGTVGIQAAALTSDAENYG